MELAGLLFIFNFPLYLTEAANVSNGAIVGAWVVVAVKQESPQLGFSMAAQPWPLL